MPYELTLEQNESNINSIPEKIINTYYEKFYQERKAPVFTSPISKFSTFIQQKPKEIVVFQINYETSKSAATDPKSSTPKNFHKSPSKSTVRNEPEPSIQALAFQSQQLNSNLLMEQSSVNIPKKNITFQLHQKKKTKGSIKHIKSDPKRQQFKLNNFQHFPSGTNVTKNTTKKKNSIEHFLKVNPYSKTVDFIESPNPEKQLKYFHSTVEVSPDKKDQLFTLQNFSHIQIHKNKKNACLVKARQVYDIVKRKQVSPSPTYNFIESSIGTDKEIQKDKNKLNFEAVSQKQKTRDRSVTPSGKNQKQGLFREFKPKIQLKRRPSTGIPLRKNRQALIQSALDQHKNAADAFQNPNSCDRTNFFNTIDTHDMRNFTPSRDGHSRRHSRGMTLNFNSPRGLKIHSKEIHLLKCVDLSETDKIKDYFNRPKDLGQNELKNIVHLQFCRKGNQNKIPRYSVKKPKDKKKEEFFQPWESVDREEQIESDQLIKREIEFEMFNNNELNY